MNGSICRLIKWRLVLGRRGGLALDVYTLRDQIQTRDVTLSVRRPKRRIFTADLIYYNVDIPVLLSRS